MCHDDDDDDDDAIFLKDESIRKLFERVIKKI